MPGKGLIMKLAVAQVKPYDNEVERNLQTHYKFVMQASDNGADLIAFPEMSLTGYVRETADELAFTEDDCRLEELRKLAVHKNIIIIAGAPVRVNSELHIGSFVMFPDNKLSIYTKQYLHTGEELFFTPSFEHNPVITIGAYKVCIAICADITNPEHPRNAKAAGGHIYIVGIFFSKPSIEGAHGLLSSYAEEHSMTVLMSNYCGHSYGTQAGGRSALWSDKGVLLSELDTEGEGILIADEQNGSWSVKKLHTD